LDGDDRPGGICPWKGRAKGDRGGSIGRGNYNVVSWERGGGRHTRTVGGEGYGTEAQRSVAKQENGSI